jgi:hypothetical protein
MAEVVDADYFYLYLETSRGRFRFPNELEYSYDKMTWIRLPANVWSNEMVSYENQLVYLRGSLKPTPDIGIGTFEFDNCIYATSGNPLSLIFGNRCDSVRDLTGYDYAFYKLFYNCDVIPDFYFLNKIDTLSPYCFAYMFAGDTRHGKLFDFEIPDIARLAPYCFYNMCANLRTELYESYQTIECTTTAPHCFDGMFRNTDINGIKMMFEEFSDGCCENMFNGCSELSYININCLSSPNEQYCLNWVEGVAESGKFIKREDAEWEDTFGPSAIPEGWDVSSGGVSGDILLDITNLNTGEVMLHEILDSSDEFPFLWLRMAIANPSYETIRNPFIIPLSSNGDIIPWRGQTYETEEPVAIMEMELLQIAEPPYIGAFFDAIIALNGELAEDFRFMDLSSFDLETGEWIIVFAIFTNGVRVSDSSGIPSLDSSEYDILDITDEYIAFRLYDFYSLFDIINSGVLSFTLFRDVT